MNSDRSPHEPFIPDQARPLPHGRHSDAFVIAFVAFEPNVLHNGSRACWIGPASCGSVIAIPPSQHQLRRRSLRRRILAALASSALLFATLTLLAWRYGFTPLPHPKPGTYLNALAPPPPAESNSFALAQAIAQLVPVFPALERDVVIVGPALGDWASAGCSLVPRFDLDALTGENPLSRILSNPMMAEVWTNATLAAPGAKASPRDRPNTLEWRKSTSHLLAYAMVRAMDSERAGRSTEALAFLAAGWRLAILVTPPQTAVSRTAEFARAWRRISTEAPALDGHEARSLLESLSSVTNALPSLEQEYLAMGGKWMEDAATVRSKRVSRILVRQSFQQAFASIANDVSQWWARLLSTAAPTSADSVPASGFHPFRYPLRVLIQYAQNSVARTTDFHRIREANLSAVLEPLRRGEADDAVWVADTIRQTAWNRPRCRRWFDRPAVWSFGSEMPPLGQICRWQQHVRADVESGRLALALRLYRVQHGSWPGQLADLVPDFMPAIPSDPFTGSPWAYERTRDGWSVRSTAAWSRTPAPTTKDNGTWSFSSADAQVVRDDHAIATQSAVTLNFRVLERYGLLPKGTQNLLLELGIPASNALALLTNRFVPPNLAALTRLLAERQSQTHPTEKPAFTNAPPETSSTNRLQIPQPQPER